MTAYTVETLVDEKRALEREVREIEAWQASMRLGRTLHAETSTVTRRLWMERSTSQRIEIPGPVQTEFYEYLRRSRQAKSERIREINRVLNNAVTEELR